MSVQGVDMPISRFTIIFLVLISFGFSSCKKEELYTPPDSSFGLIYTQVFSTSCALSGCHVQGKKKNDPSGQVPILAGAATYDNLINATPVNTQAVAAGLKQVEPGNALGRFLYNKVRYDSTGLIAGSKMPGAGLIVTDDQIEFIRQWIDAGAPLEGHVADRNLMD